MKIRLPHKTDKMNCVPKLEFGLKSEGDGTVASDKMEDKESKEDGVEINIKTEEIMLEDFKQENDPDPSTGSTSQINFTDPTLGHVVYLPSIKSELMSEESDSDQDEDFSLKCEIELGDYGEPKLEGETVVKIEPSTSDSNTAGYSIQESKIPHVKGGDHNRSHCEEEATKRGLMGLLKVIDGCLTYCCEVCPYKTTHHSHMKQHVNIHTGDKPYECRVCLHSFTQAAHLKTHMNIHIGEMPFKCEQCPFSSSRANTLKSHIMTHTQEKPFACSFCDYKAARKTHLTQHLRVHSGDKPFECSQCGYKFSQKPHLKIHITRRHGDQRT